MNFKPQIALATAAAVMLAAPASAQQYVTYTENALPYTVSLPADWYGLQMKGPAGVNLTSAQKAPFLPLIRLTYIPKTDAVNTLPKAVAAFEKELSNNGSITLKRLGNKDAKYGNIAGKEMEYSLTGGGNELRVRLWMGLGAKNVYAFQLMDKPATYAANRDKTFGPILNSVKFK
ncbi:MAG: hypothetical protein Q4C67_08425 [Deinococcus sp.]|nr:hypothetical protein [Deinococcus sp.]